MATQVLITGGSGLVGQRLSQMLLERGYGVSWLSRQAAQKGKVKTYRWDVQRQYIDPEALQNVQYIVHLAGAGVADGRWTEERKKLILESRTQSTRLLANALQKQAHSVRAFVGASAIGLYGAHTGNVLVGEGFPPANDFLAQVVRQWEAETDRIADRLRTVKIRIGVVLSAQGGALPQMALPVRLFAGAPLGSGKQWVSWIHIDDLCRMFIKAIEDEQMHGAYNGVAPQPLTNQQLTRAIGQVLHRPVWPLHVPAFALNLALGEMATVVLGGSRVSSKKIEEAGFAFQFPDAMSALNNLIG